MGVIAYVDPTIAHTGDTSALQFKINLLDTCDVPSHHHLILPLEWHLILHYMFIMDPTLGDYLYVLWTDLYCDIIFIHGHVYSLGRGHNFTPPSICLES